MREVVVLGGGIPGCAAALALGDRGIDDVLVVEAGTYDRCQIGETIPPDTRLLLERLRLWDGFVDQEHEPRLGSQSAWGADVVGYNDFLLNPHSVGWHLDRRKFGTFMAERAAQSGAEVRSGARFVAAELGAEGTLAVLLQTGEGLERIPARFVVDATGIQSRFAKAMGARPLLHDRLLWIGAVLDRPIDLQPSRLTMIEAVEYGWWYAAGVPDGRTIVGAITDAETNRRIARLGPDGGVFIWRRPGTWLPGWRIAASATTD
jgi:flavin-dependent dehydrogenase